MICGGSRIGGMNATVSVVRGFVGAMEDVEAEVILELGDASAASECDEENLDPI